MTRSTPEGKKPRPAGARLLAPSADRQARSEAGAAGCGARRRWRGISDRARRARARVFTGRAHQGCRFDFLLGGGAGRSLAAEITCEMDQQERRDLGGLSERPNSHSRSRRDQCGEVRQPDGQQGLPASPTPTPRCDSSSQFLCDNRDCNLGRVVIGAKCHTLLLGSSASLDPHEKL